MSDIAIEVGAGKTKRLKTANKICKGDIIVTATGGSGGGCTQEELDAAVAKAIKDGKQAEYDRFWDAFQAYDEEIGKATKTGYSNCFANNHWKDDTYNPKYDIVCTNGSGNATNIFYGATEITNTKVPIRVNGMVLTGAFTRCSSLVTIPLLELNGVTGFSQTFTGCYNLQNITIAGSIDVNFNISATAVLSPASVQSIIDHLAQLTDETTQTLTVHQTVRNAMTTEQVNEIVNDKKWTLAPAAATN